MSSLISFTIVITSDCRYANLKLLLWWREQFQWLGQFYNSMKYTSLSFLHCIVFLIVFLILRHAWNIYLASNAVQLDWVDSTGIWLARLTSGVPLSILVHKISIDMITWLLLTRQVSYICCVLLKTTHNIWDNKPYQSLKTFWNRFLKLLFYSQ